LDSKFAGIFIAVEALAAPVFGAAVVAPVAGLVEDAGAGDLLAVWPAVAGGGVADIIYNYL
jgi:hypothetical protein